MSPTMKEIDVRLGYKENVTLSRDDFNEIEAEMAEYAAIESELQDTLSSLSATQKQLEMACDIIDGIIECIDDDGVVTPGDKKLLSQRIKSAVKFTGNV